MFICVCTQSRRKMAEGEENKGTRSNLIVAGSFSRQNLTKQLFSNDLLRGGGISPNDKSFPSLLPTRPPTNMLSD